MTPPAMAYANLFKIMKLFFTFVLATHWVACLFAFISDLQSSSNGWWKSNETVTTNLSSKYGAFFYAAILLLIGENINPRTELEEGFCSLMILFGAALYTTMFGQVSLLIATMNMEESTYVNSVASVSHTMRAFDLPSDVRKRVTDYREYMFHRYRSADLDDFLKGLSENLRDEVILYINVQLLEKIPLFEDSDPQFVITICRYLKQQIFQPGDYVARIGQKGDRVYFLSIGEVEMEEINATGHLEACGRLYPGESFGLRSVLDASFLVTMNYRAILYSDLSILKRQDLMDVLNCFPETKLRITARAKSSLKSIKVANSSAGISKLKRAAGSLIRTKTLANLSQQQVESLQAQAVQR